MDIEKQSIEFEKAILQFKIRRNAQGNFSKFISKRTESKDVIQVLNFAAKKANDDQRQVVETAKNK